MENNKKTDRTVMRFVVYPVLIAVMLSSVSCGFIVFNDSVDTGTKTSAPTDSTGTTAVTTTSASVTTKIDPHEASLSRLDTLPNRDLGSSSVIIATTDSETICPTETSSEVIASRAVVARDVENKYNTLIISDTQDADSMLTAAKEAYASDMYYADLLAVPRSMIGSLYANGILANMYSLPFTDYTHEYYDQSMISEAVIGNELSAVSGAANFNPEYLNCIYFNRGLIEEYSLENPYELVYSGEWTWDKLGELSKAVAADINGNSTGIYGHGSELETSTYIDLAASSMDIKYVTNTEGQLPAVSYMADENLTAHAKGIVDKLYALFYSNTGVVPAKESARGYFTSGTLLFYTDRMYVTTWLPNSTINWGILPLPKYDESQEGYLSPLSDDAPVFCALANTPNYDTSGLILEALNAASYEYVLDVYMNDRVNYYLRDNDSINMLELIVDGATGDFTHMFASGFSNLANATYSAIYSAVTTRSTLETLYKRYRSTTDKELSAAVDIYE